MIFSQYSWVLSAKFTTWVFEWYQAKTVLLNYFSPRVLNIYPKYTLETIVKICPFEENLHFRTPNVDFDVLVTGKKIIFCYPAEVLPCQRPNVNCVIFPGTICGTMCYTICKTISDTICATISTSVTLWRSLSLFSNVSSTIHCSTVKYSTLHYREVHYMAIQYSTVH